MKNWIPVIVTMALVGGFAKSQAGEISGAITYPGSQSGPVIVRAAQTLSGNRVLNLDGNGDYASTTVTDLSGSELTIQYWFKGNSMQSAVRQQSGGFLVAGWNNQHILSHDGGTAGISAGEGVNDGQWHHVLMTWKQGTAGGFASYLDGKLVTRRDSADAPIPNHNAQVNFGSFNGTEEFAQGQLDDIAIWRRALTEVEVTSGWNRRLTGNEADLVGYWSFDDATPNDASPNQNHAELWGDAVIQAADIPGLGGGLAEQVLAEPGSYTLGNLPDGPGYSVTAFRDATGNLRQNAGEPFAVYSGNPFTLTGTRSGVDLELVELPRITTQPLGARLGAGVEVTLTVAALGTGPLSYQWLKDDVALSDGGRLSGVGKSELRITSAQEADSGIYTVRVSNPVGTVTSDSAALQVISGGAILSGTVSYSGTQTGKVIVSASQRPQGNQALRLDGNGDSVATPLLDLSGSEITIQYWFRGSLPYSLVRQQSGGYLVAGWSGDFLHILSNDQGTAGISMGTNVVDGAWHHVVMTWKQDTVGGFASYLDGRLVAKRDSSNQPIPNHNAQVYLGSWNGTGEFAKGELDEIAIWRRALTASEVAAAWRSSPNGSEADLVAFWNFNDGTANDLTTAANHGELLGDATIVAADIANLGNAFEVETAGPGAYELVNVAPGSGYLVTAFLDVNGSGLADPGEPSGEFSGNPLTVSGSVGEVNISLTEPPRIVLPPVQARTAAGGTVQFAVAAEGTAPLTYRWSKDGMALTDGGRISGASGATLSVATTSTADEGEYTVEISNAQGTVSSRPANLWVVAGGLSVSGDLQYGGSSRVYVNATRFPADDRALKLNGTAAYAVVPTLTDLSGAAGEELTIQYWFKGSSLQSAVRQQSGGFIVAGWGGLHILSHDGGVNGISAGAGVTDGQWHHVALTWKVGTVGGFASYLDGKLVEQRDSGVDPIPALNAPVYFGAFDGTGEFASGLLDEISIWNRALSAEEIHAGWKQSLAGSETDLVGYWNFNSGTAEDLSPNAHVGELKNGAEIVVAENAKRAGGDYVSAFTASGPYTMAELPSGTNYRVTAFVDLNANGILDGGEPTTAYAGNPFDLLSGKTGVDLDLGGGTEAPALSINEVGGNVTIAWPAGVSGYVLQETTSLMAPDWKPVTGVTGNTATVPASGTSRFYRLVK